MQVHHSYSFSILEEPGGLETVLIGAGALPLLAEVKNAASKMDLEAGSFAVLAVHRFIQRADDEAWASLSSCANAEQDAFGSIVVRILRKAVMDANEVFQ